MTKKINLIVVCFIIISNGAFAQWTGSTSTVGNIYRDGNVGIGTTNPVEKLDVQGTVKATNFLSGNLTLTLNDNFIYDGRTFGHYAFSWGPDSWNGAPSAWLSAYGGFKLFTAGQLRMSTDINGNVGIGTTNTGSCKLAVEGKIGAREVVVTTGAFPDYVFHPFYNLMDLTSLEKYIKEHSHLPGIPTAVEVEKDGMKLGELQTKLVEKIEELTLYVIDLKKEIEQLKKERR